MVAWPEADEGLGAICDDTLESRSYLKLSLLLKQTTRSTVLWNSANGMLALVATRDQYRQLSCGVKYLSQVCNKKHRSCLHGVLRIKCWVACLI